MRFGIANDLLFESGALIGIGEIIKGFGSDKILVVCDKIVFENGTGITIVDSLEKANISYDVFDGVQQEPTDIAVNDTADQYRGKGIQLILAVGGGSIMDFSKALAVCLTNIGGIASFEGAESVENRPIPVVAVPTTSGTGSEVTSFAIVTNTQQVRKMVIAGKHMRAALAVCDPCLLLTLPQKLTAYTGMDALTHAMEAYVSRLSSPISDLFAIKAIQLIGANLRLCCQEPDNLQARSNMMLGSLLAGYAFDNAILGLAHAMAHPLGAHFHIPHGAANAMVLAEVVRYNSQAVPQKTLDMGIALGLDPANITVDSVAKAVKHLERDLAIPHLSDYGISEKDFDLLADAALQESCLPLNPRDCTKADIVQCYKNVYESL